MSETADGKRAPGNVTGLLQEWSAGSREARERLVTLVYDELRRLARTQLRRERPDHTLSSAALVNETYIRLVDQRSATFQDRAHFYAVAATLMRRVLVDHARARGAARRGGGLVRVPIEDAEPVDAPPPVDLLALDEALTELEGVDPGLVRLVELRFFAGFGLEQTAEALGVSRATVARDWQFARGWLGRKMAS